MSLYNYIIIIRYTRPNKFLWDGFHYVTTDALIQLPLLTIYIKDGVFTVVDLLLYLARRLN